MSDSRYIPNLATLCYLIDEDRILLGKKKYGGAKDKINGFGGKVEYTDKSIADAVIREFKEETNIDISSPILTSVLFFNSLDTKTQEKKNVNIYVYIANSYKGIPEESEEMTVEWIDLKSIPFDQMWENDRLWFNIVMSGKKSIIELVSVDGVLSKLNVTFKEDLVLYQ